MDETSLNELEEEWMEPTCDDNVQTGPSFKVDMGTEEQHMHLFYNNLNAASL